MYFVDEKAFDELFDAIDYCKGRPTTILKNEKGEVLMRHTHVPFELFRDIQIAKAVLELQLCPSK
jgi:hypothetical protein